MSKRVSNGASEHADLSRPKRARREGIPSQTLAELSEVDVAMSDQGGSDAEDDDGHAAARPMTAAEVKALGSSLIQTAKDAVSKDGHLLAPIFLKKPSKKLYPDYYQIIQQPIAFEDIKSKLDKGHYPTLEAVRQDFELCFNNAKTYNLEGSQVWLDAKELMKVVNKAYGKLVPSEEKKPKSLGRLLKSRLQKLVDKTDETGRPLSTEFMQLPSRKLWPNYYKEIKKPQCFDNIFKRLKRKEYQTSEEFAADVELIFSNAMTFNQDHTPIWEDALTLRNTFRQLLSDLPPPHSIPHYTQPSTKIKIKPPTMQASSSASKIEQTPSLMLRVPAVPAAQKPAAAPVPAPEPTLPVARNIAKPIPPSPAPKPSKPSKPPAAAPASTPAKPASSKAPAPGTLPVMRATATPRAATAQAATAITPYPSTSHIQTPAPIQTAAPAPVVLTPVAAPEQFNIPVVPAPVLQQQQQQQQPAPAPVVPAAVPAPPPPRIPTPPPSSQWQLKCAQVEILPRGRILNLDHRDGVKSWALRLAPGESRVLVRDVTWLNPPTLDEEDTSEEEEEEEEEDDMDVDNTPTKNGRTKKPKGKRRGRPTRASARQAASKTAKKKSDKPGEIQIKVNKMLVKEQPDVPGEWDIHLPVGPSVIEIGESDGLIWKLYVERMGTV